MPPFIILSLVFLLLALSGVIIANKLFQRVNPILIIGLGSVIGPLGLLLTAGISSYIFKGFFAETLVFFTYTLSIIIWGFKDLRQLKLDFKKYFTKISLLLGLIIIGYLYAFFLIASAFDLGGDVDVYFSIATSFAKGNYPSYLPWQPKFLTGYHMGVFIVEGIIFAVTKLSIYTIHCFFSAYIISALFLLITGITIQKHGRSLITIIPALFGIVLFGGPVILINGIKNFSFQLSNLNLYPQLVDFKGSIGGGTGDFFGLFYRNFYPFSLATLIIALYSLAIYPWKTRLFTKYLIVAILLILTASIDESLFLLELFFTGFYFVLDFVKYPTLRSPKLLAVLTLVFFTLFLLIQNTVRDAIFDPAQEGVRFKILLPGNTSKSSHPDKFTLIPGDQEFMQYFNAADDQGNGKSPVGIVPINFLLKNLEALGSGVKTVHSTTWFLPNILLITLIALVSALIVKSRLAILLAFSSLITSAISVFIVYTFFPPTSIRFVNQASQFTILALGFIVTDTWFLIKNRVAKIILTTAVLLLIGPQLITSHSRIFGLITKPTRHNFQISRLTYEPTFKLIDQYIPFNARVLFLDGYPFETQASGITAEAITRAGFFVPIGPPDFKSTNSDASSEWVDAVTSLNPSSLKALGVEYIYVGNHALDRLKTFSVDLKNTAYFKLLTQTDTGALYRVENSYKDLPNQPTSIAKLIESIPAGSKIYLDRFKLNELRRGLVLHLAKKTQAVGPGFSAGGDYFMYIETFLPFTYICEAPSLPVCSPNVTEKFEPIDYIITSPEKDLRSITNSTFTKYIDTPLVVVWQRINI